MHPVQDASDCRRGVNASPSRPSACSEEKEKTPCPDHGIGPFPVAVQRRGTLPRPLSCTSTFGSLRGAPGRPSSTYRRSSRPQSPHPRPRQPGPPVHRLRLRPARGSPLLRPPGLLLRWLRRWHLPGRRLRSPAQPLEESRVRPRSGFGVGLFVPRRWAYSFAVPASGGRTWYCPFRPERLRGDGWIARRIAGCGPSVRPTAD